MIDTKIHIDFINETVVALSRYLFRHDQNNRMVAYLSRFRVEKEDIVSLYKDYEEVMMSIYHFFDEINVQQKMNEKIIGYLEPVLDNESFIEHYYRVREILEYDDADHFFEYLINEYYSFRLKGYRHINQANDLIDVMSIITDDDKVKLMALSIYSDFELIIKSIDQFANEIVSEIGKRLKPLVDKALILQKNIKDDFVIDFCKRWNRNYDNITVKVFILRYCVWELEGTDYKQELRLNYMYDKIIEINDDKKKDEQKVVDVFKALADKNRYKIVRLLSMRRKMYVSEMADCLHVTSSTVLHHLDILKSNGIVKTCVDSVDNKRIYYELDYKVIRLLKVTLEDMMGGNYK